MATLRTRVQAHRTAVIFGCAGLELSAEEREFFAAVRPFGFILFARNINAPAQVRKLVADLRHAVGDEGEGEAEAEGKAAADSAHTHDHHHDVPILIDQEGGKVRRLRPPHWREAPAAELFARMFADDADVAVDAARRNSRLMAAELRGLGIDVNCLPVLDLPTAESHAVIGNRAYGRTAAQVARLGKAAAQGLLDGGVLPVIKHLPGHGRARVDSHAELPRVETGVAVLDATDFAPFRELAELPLGMSAHIVYEAVDAALPATLSKAVIRDIVRGRIGYDGLLMSDDLAMGALDGDYTRLAAAGRRAGCDIMLHCNGNLAEMQAVAEGAGMMDAQAVRRWHRARDMRRTPALHVDMLAEEAAFQALIAPWCSP